MFMTSDAVQSIPLRMISAVIPTRNRPASLRRTLQALARQQRAPDEVIVADASERPVPVDTLRTWYPRAGLTAFTAVPSVCAQRNAAIARARGSHVLLCDDDIEPPPEYLSTLATYLERDPSAGAVTGVVREPDAAGQFGPGFPVPAFRSLVAAFLFQRTVWGDLEAAGGTWLTALPLAALKRWYRHRGNTWSLAGWPLVTQVRGPVVRTAIYGLGAALIRRDWLIASPYDERLGPHGIGDNYGVALGFPGGRSVTVLTDLAILHHKAADNRLDATTAYYQRVLALHCFMRSDARFSGWNTAWLVWSLLGNAGLFAARGQTAFLAATLRALRVIVTGRNPLVTQRRASAPAAAGAAP